MEGLFLYFDPPNLTEYYNKLLSESRKGLLSEKQFLYNEIINWKISCKRNEQITGDKYYSGYHDILARKRTAIGQDGSLINVENLPNNKIIDNQYKKVVDQKTNYLVGLPIVFDTDNDTYYQLLANVFDVNFNRLLRMLCIDCLNCGIAWLYPYYDLNGNFHFKRFSPFEILPFWADNEHSKLEAAIRCYDVWVYERNNKKLVEKVELYTASGVEYFEIHGNQLIIDAQKEPEPYIKLDGTPLQWDRLPLIPFRANYLEIPIIRDLKSLQDSINDTLSDYQNSMQEDCRNTILIIKNYDGENLGEFRQNLATYGAVKVRDDGDVSTLSINRDFDSYRSFLEFKKKELISAAKSYDASDLKLGNTPNEMNIKSVFNDINMDANAMELEFQNSFKNLLWFVNTHFYNSGFGNFFSEQVKIIFNKDQIVNESDIITDIRNSVGIISNETLIKNHPYVSDIQEEMENLNREKKQNIDDYVDPA